MAHELRVGQYTAGAQIVAALIALVGVLVTADAKASGQQGTGATPPLMSASATQTPLTGLTTCATVIDWYRMSLRQDPDMLAFLTTPGSDGLSPVEKDPDARRCGLSKEGLSALG